MQQMRDGAPVQRCALFVCCGSVAMKQPARQEPSINKIFSQCASKSRERRACIFPQAAGTSGGCHGNVSAAASLQPTRMISGSVHNQRAAWSDKAYVCAPSLPPAAQPWPRSVSWFRWLRKGALSPKVGPVLYAARGNRWQVGQRLVAAAGRVCSGAEPSPGSWCGQRQTRQSACTAKQQGQVQRARAQERGEGRVQNVHGRHVRTATWVHCLG
jgi:hypothetical protein